MPIAAARRVRRVRRTVSFALVAVLACAAASVPAAALAASPAPAADPVVVPPGATVLGDTVAFSGRGYGHGVGMSQYGARGRALDGQDAATILAHYYAGTTLAPRPASTIRVLVLSAWAATAAKPLVVYGRAREWTIDGVVGTFPPDARLRLIPTTTVTAGVQRTTWRIRVDSAARVLLANVPAKGQVTVRAVGAHGRLQLWSKPGTYDTYRGVLRLRPGTINPVVSVVNDVTLELYLRGVVPAEMPATWPAAALQAQAVAARSYAARRLRPGVSYYDLVDDSRAQVYRGSLGEKGAASAAVVATAGLVLKSGSAIANTLFHSSDGGATEDNENVYTSATGAIVAGPVLYLRGSADRRDDGTAYDAAGPYATWSMAPYGRTRLSAWFDGDPRTAVGDLVALDLSDRGGSGRLVRVTLIGTAGTKTVSGEVFRAILNAARPAADPMMRSTLFDTSPIP
jgi:peptidoglycan hydrolase-like amidase